MNYITHIILDAEIHEEANRIKRSSKFRGVEYDNVLDSAILRIISRLLERAKLYGIRKVKFSWQPGFELPGWTLDDEETAKVTFNFRNKDDAFCFRLWVL